MQQQELVAGDSLNFLTAGGAYPASSGWVLKYRLAPRTGANTAIDITATAEGDDHRVAIAAVSTSSWAADNYTWVSWVEKAGEVYTVDNGQLVVKPNPRTLPAGYDGRSGARRALDEARTAFYAWNPTQRRYKIGDREMEFNSTGDILKKIKQLEQEVLAEEVMAGRTEKVGRRIHSRI